MTIYVYSLSSWKKKKIYSVCYLVSVIWKCPGGGTALCLAFLRRSFVAGGAKVAQFQRCCLQTDLTWPRRCSWKIMTAILRAGWRECVWIEELLFHGCDVLGSDSVSANSRRFLRWLWLRRCRWLLFLWRADILQMGALLNNVILVIVCRDRPGFRGKANTIIFASGYSFYDFCGTGCDAMVIISFLYIR